MATFSARYDGEVIVPEEPVDLPVGEAITLTVTPMKGGASGNANETSDREGAADQAGQQNPSDLPLDEWLERFRNAPRISTHVHVPLEAMRRETIYGERK